MPQASDCPRSIPAETKSAGTDSMHFGEAPGTKTVGLTWEWQKNGSLKIVWKRNKSVALAPPYAAGNEETAEILTVQVWRGSAD